MKTYQILLLDKVTKEIEKVENFQETKMTLKERLLELQDGYCVDEKLTYDIVPITSHGRKLNMAIAECDADFSYIAIV
jgi:hypothetical protein